MIDALGAPQRVLLIGGTSDIGQAIVRELVGADRVRSVVLASRCPEEAEPFADELRDGGIDVASVAFDVTATATHEATLARATTQLGDIDVAVMAAGVLGDQDEAEADPSAAVATAMANYVGPMSVCLHLGNRLRDQGHGVLVVLSSVAGDRPRRANFVYGSTKAGLDALATGLGDALHGSGARVVVVRPGFVRTSMTDGLDEAPLTVDPADVASAVRAAVAGRSELVYVPRQIGAVMRVLKALPRPIFRRLPI
ncbi:MAG: decaprenylphospho-beta-D-erythro-pentofuranosid-2-ulose 2-reductase [Actinomycetota bacterium]